MAKVKATASNVTVSFGLISFPVDLVPATRSKSNKAATVSTKSICPTCTEPNPVSQVYQCDKGHGPFARGDIHKGLVIDGTLCRPTDEQLATLEVVDGIRGTVALTVHPAEQVEAHTMPSGNIYRLRPRGNEEHYALVRALVEDADIAFLAELTNKGATKLYRMVAREGLLVLAELVRPSELHEPEEGPLVELDERLVATGRILVETMMEGFEPGSFVDKRKERLLELADAVVLGRDDRTPSPAALAAAELAALINRAA